MLSSSNTILNNTDRATANSTFNWIYRIMFYNPNHLPAISKILNSISVHFSMNDIQVFQIFVISQYSLFIYIYLCMYMETYIQLKMNIPEYFHFHYMNIEYKPTTINTKWFWTANSFILEQKWAFCCSIVHAMNIVKWNGGNNTNKIQFCLYFLQIKHKFCISSYKLICLTKSLLVKFCIFDELKYGTMQHFKHFAFIKHLHNSTL